MTGKDDLKKAVAQTIGLLSILPFMPGDVETVTKAWLWCVADEGYTPIDLRNAGKAMLKELERFPAPSTMLEYCERARSIRRAEELQRCVLAQDGKGRLWHALPEHVDGVELFHAEKPALPKRSLDEAKRIVKRVLGIGDGDDA